MQSLRTDRPWGRFLGRLVLAWFALALGAAIASSIVQPQSVETICSGAGHFKWLIKSADGDLQEENASKAATLDCPLCAGLGTAPPSEHATALPPDALAHALHPLFAAHIASLSAPPLPSRGPPARA
jgi:hypothetical protein